jgi:hypothetical protein
MLGTLIGTALLCLLIVLTSIAFTSVRVGARQPETPETRTFIFVRDLLHEPPHNVVGAKVIARRISDKEEWPFPATNAGGWTKRFIPDGVYLVSITADGHEPTFLKITVPTKGKYPHRTFEAWMEPRKQ